MNIDFTLAIDLIIWLLVAIAIVIGHWRRSKSGTGLILAYLLLFWLTHWLPALFYLMPWHTPYYEPALVKIGFHQSLYGIIALAIGVLLLGPLLSRFFRTRQQRPQTFVGKTDSISVSETAKIYIVVGIVSYFILLPPSRSIPTLSAITFGLSRLTIVGLVLACWDAIQVGDSRSLTKWLFLSGLWPIITVVQQGFLKSGFDMFIVVFMFVVYFVGRRSRRFVVITTLLGYFILSGFVTYMQNRPAIRNIIWNRSSTIGQRIEAVSSTATDFHLLNLTETEELRPIDLRFNQNVLTGSTVYRLTRGHVDHAKGETIADAILMVVPRAIWPNKPIRRGGSELVTRYSGVSFYGGTSVLPGQVMEFHLNFGTTGVVLGLLVFGIILSIIDESAARNIHNQRWKRFAMWYLPGISLLQPANFLVAITGAAVSGLVTITLVNYLLVPLLRRTLLPRHRALRARLIEQNRMIR